LESISKKKSPQRPLASECAWQRVAEMFFSGLRPESARHAVKTQAYLARVIVDVEATPALSRQKMVAARKMVERVEKLGLRPESLGADKAYGKWRISGVVVVQPHIPVIARRHQTGGHFTRDQFRYEPAENVYYCPEGKPLRHRGQHRTERGSSYCLTAAQCQGCPQKTRCTPTPYRTLFIHWDEPARQVARASAGKRASTAQNLKRFGAFSRATAAPVENSARVSHATES
jgi:hypothetical protein